MPYFWFFINNRKLGVFLFFNDIKLFIFGFIDFISNLTDRLVFFKNYSFFYWNESSIITGNTQFRKHGIRDIFIRQLNV